MSKLRRYSRSFTDFILDLVKRDGRMKQALMES